MMWQQRDRLLLLLFVLRCVQRTHAFLPSLPDFPSASSKTSLSDYCPPSGSRNVSIITDGSRQPERMDGTIDKAPPPLSLDRNERPRRPRSRQQAKWCKQYEALVTYKKNNGDCLVPRNYETKNGEKLGNWVEQQRAHYRKLHISKPSPMLEERIELLESIGFAWTPRRDNWESMYNRLVDYKEEFGDCLVPKEYSKDPQLSYWVNAQRQCYKKLQAGHLSPITEERIRRLEKIGFVWTLCRRESWESMYDHLGDYKEEFGDCLVPQKYSKDPKLGRWVMAQRQCYKKLQAGKLSSMTEERIQLLEKIGFVWTLKRKEN